MLLITMDNQRFFLNQEVESFAFVFVFWHTHPSTKIVHSLYTFSRLFVFVVNCTEFFPCQAKIIKQWFDYHRRKKQHSRFRTSRWCLVPVPTTIRKSISHRTYAQVFVYSALKDAALSSRDILHFMFFYTKKHTLPVHIFNGDFWRTTHTSFYTVMNEEIGYSLKVNLFFDILTILPQDEESFHKLIFPKYLNVSMPGRREKPSL